MESVGEFVSEVYRDGKTFYFEARYSTLRWSARIWDEDGRPHGWIACRSTGPRLQGDALEDAVCDWVHRAVVHEVGFHAHGGSGLEPVHDLQGVDVDIGFLSDECMPPEAANAPSYGPRPAAAPLQAADRTAFKEIQARNRALRAQSEQVLARFLAVASGATRKRRETSELQPHAVGT